MEDTPIYNPPRSLSVAEITEMALQDGEALWKSVIRDTEARYAGDIEEITALYEEIGWGPEIENAGGYSEAKGHAWCGVFAGAVFMNVNGTGAGVDPKLIFKVFTSTYRFFTPSYWAAVGHTRPDNVAPNDIQRGDIVSVVTKKKKPYGDHIVIALGPVVKGGYFPTLEGNGKGGRLGDGTKAEGVIKRNRRRFDVRQVIRLNESHMVWPNQE